MTRLLIVAMLVVIMLASIPMPIAGQECLDDGKVVSGELGGSGKSSDTHIYCIKKYDKGTWVSVTVTVKHVRLFTSRVITGIEREDGGFLLYNDETLPTYGGKTYTYNWYVTGSDERLRVVLTSIADIRTPSVINYTISLTTSKALDAGVVLSKSNTGSVETITLNIGDAPGGVYSDESLPELPKIGPGQSLSFDGHLSANIVKKTEKGVELYGGRDTSDIYALPVEAPANSRLNITVTPPRGASLLVVLRSEDGAALVSASSRRAGEPATLSTSFIKAVKDGRLLVDVQLLRSDVPGVAYTVEIVLSEPPKPEAQVEFKPPFPESQARTIVIGFSATVIALTIASVVIGWFRRRPERQPAYYW